MDDFKSAFFLLEDRFYVVKYRKFISLWRLPKLTYMESDAWYVDTYLNALAIWITGREFAPLKGFA